MPARPRNTHINSPREPIPSNPPAEVRRFPMTGQLGKLLNLRSHILE
jgi:hypothetical protein